MSTQAAHDKPGLARRSRRSTTRPTRIRCDAPEATTVTVAGSFNDWNTEGLPLHRMDDGHWALVLDLPPGRYEYKFIADGCWCCEFGTDDTTPSEGRVPNVFGTMNLVLVVE